jgi:hypothetical protein
MTDLLPEKQIWTVEPCYRPKLHTGACGEPLTRAEEDTVILFGRCGAPRPPYGLMNAGKPPR